MVANLSEKNKKYSKEALSTLLDAQVENSLELGWNPKDIIIASNFDYSFNGVKSTEVKLNDFCFTGSKIFALKWLFESGYAPEAVWAHDLDAWQNYEFKCPSFVDVGATFYSRPKYNGGSIFWRWSSDDIVSRIAETIRKNNFEKEEPIINKVFKSKEFSWRVTKLNSTFNVGCSGFVKRINRSIKPVRVLHFKPTNRIAWETFALDRNGIGEYPISKRLEKLLRKYYPNLSYNINKRKPTSYGWPAQ